MFKKTTFIVVSIVIAAIGAYVYFAYRTPSDVVPQSGSEQLVAWIGLATSIVGLLTALAGLFSKILDARAK